MVLLASRVNNSVCVAGPQVITDTDQVSERLSHFKDPLGMDLLEGELEGEA